LAKLSFVDGNLIALILPLASIAPIGAISEALSFGEGWVRMAV
jgi:hypothetical protein